MGPVPSIKPNWEPAEGRIIDSRITKHVPVGPGFNEVALHEYVVDVRQADGHVFRTTIEQTIEIADPDVGAMVRVEIDAKSRTVRFDANDPQLNVDAQLKAMRNREKHTFESELQQPPDSQTP